MTEPGPRPAFAEGFPSDPALDALVRAFAAGDYARVRREAPALEKASEEVDVKRAAAELLARTRPDPLMVMLLALTAALLAGLSIYWVAKGG